MEGADQDVDHHHDTRADHDDHDHQTTVVPAPTAKTTTGGSAPTKTTTPTTTPVAPTTTTTTTPPPVTTSGTAPNAPSGIGVPTNLVFDDEFSGGSLNQTVWSPTWFGNVSQQNGTTMSASNVSVGSSGLALKTGSNGTGGIVSSNPHDSQPGHTGFQIVPTAGKPVYVEYKATLPAAPNGSIANWPAVWLVGQSPWPENGEIDVMEGLGGAAAYHIHFGNGNGSGVDGPGKTVNTSPGTHTYGVLWTTTSVTFIYDGVAVGTINESLDSPMFLIMENSIGSYGGPTVLSATMTIRYVRVWQ